jgi:hypothetical protein
MAGEKEIGIRGLIYARNYAKELNEAAASVSQQHAGKVLCLRCGTSLERIAAESATLALFDFVHRDIWHPSAPTIPDRVVGVVPFIENSSKILTCRIEESFSRSQAPPSCE